jgi:ABC-type multidrug transport system ATPase subunit
MLENAIKVNKLFKRFGEFNALNGLSFEVFKGDIFGFLGPNGAGKSTTIRILASLIRPDSGEVFLFGKNLNLQDKNIRNNIGFLIERPDFYNYLSAKTNLEILQQTSGLAKDTRKIEELLEWVGLKGRESDKVGTFSQGMKQRLGLAQTLLHNPGILVLDEPSNGLDPQGIKDMRNLITSLNKDHNKTIFLSSHLLWEIELMANRMVIIKDGKNIIEGNVSELVSTHVAKVEIETNDIESLNLFLKDKKISYSVSIERPQLFQLSYSATEVPHLIKQLNTANISVYSIKPLKALEDYFLSKTDVHVN